MSYLPLDHRFFTNPKHASLSHKAILLHVTGIHYSSSSLTDGFLPKRPASLWAMHLVEDGVDIDPIIRELIDAGLWADNGNDWHIINYLDWNWSKHQVVEQQQRKAENQKAYLERKKAAKNASSPNPVDVDKDLDKARLSHDRLVTDGVTGHTEGGTPDPRQKLRSLRGGAA